jgi:DnaJ-class molecular chaperone
MTWKDNYKRYDPEREGYGSKSEWRRSFRERMNPDECSRILGEDDPYAILGIRNPSTKDAIKKAYYKMAMKWHPDRNPHQVELANETMKRINAAYDLLYY